MAYRTEYDTETHLLKVVRRIRREWGNSVADFLLVQLVETGSITTVMSKLGLRDTGLGAERGDMILNYLRQHGATKFVLKIQRSYDDIDGLLTPEATIIDYSTNWRHSDENGDLQSHQDDETEAGHTVPRKIPVRSARLMPRPLQA